MYISTAMLFFPLNCENFSLFIRSGFPLWYMHMAANMHVHILQMTKWCIYCRVVTIFSKGFTVATIKHLCHAVVMLLSVDQVPGVKLVSLSFSKYFVLFYEPVVLVGLNKCLLCQACCVCVC